MMMSIGVASGRMVWSRRPGPVPADDPGRVLTHVSPDTDDSLPHLGVVGDTYTILVSGADTAGRYTLIDMHVPPGGGPPPHRHDFEEMFTILDGRDPGRPEHQRNRAAPALPAKVATAAGLCRALAGRGGGCGVTCGAGIRCGRVWRNATWRAGAGDEPGSDPEQLVSSRLRGAAEGTLRWARPARSRWRSPWCSRGN
jgi:hypothetical protein